MRTNYYLICSQNDGLARKSRDAAVRSPSPPVQWGTLRITIMWYPLITAPNGPDITVGTDFFAGAESGKGDATSSKETKVSFPDESGRSSNSCVDFGGHHPPERFDSAIMTTNVFLACSEYRGKVDPRLSA
jgi:hypothetical protein